jgi:putative transposase
VNKGQERKLNRLSGYDYSTPGVYFITICIRNFDGQFGEIKNGIMELNEIGKIAAQCWEDIPNHFPNASIDAFVIMPNHVHGIIAIVVPLVGNADLRSLRKRRQMDDRTKMSIPKIIHGYKSSVTRIINRQYNKDFAWQKSFHDRIIRDDDELNRIREYIANNPANWAADDNVGDGHIHSI